MMNVKNIMVLTVLWGLLILSAMLVVNVTHSVRLATNKLNLLDKAYNSETQKRNRLTMELNTIGGFISVERAARNEFQMVDVPSKLERVVYE